MPAKKKYFFFIIKRIAFIFINMPINKIVFICFIKPIYIKHISQSFKNFICEAFQNFKWEWKIIRLKVYIKSAIRWRFQDRVGYRTPKIQSIIQYTHLGQLSFDKFGYPQSPWRYNDSNILKVAADPFKMFGGIFSVISALAESVDLGIVHCSH